MIEFISYVVFFFVFSLLFAWISYSTRTKKGLPPYMPSLILARMYLLFFLFGLYRYCVYFN